MSDEQRQREQAQEPQDEAIYSEFDAFLREAIHRYYQRCGTWKKGNFIALLIASGEVGSMALESVTSATGLRKIAMGAAGVLALRIGLRYALSGPLGIVLAGATVASVVAYFVQNRKQIASRIVRNRELVLALRREYEGLQSDHRDGRVDDQRRALMVDGLLSRFLADLERK